MLYTVTTNHVSSRITPDITGGNARKRKLQKRRLGTQHIESERHILLVSEGKIIRFMVSLLKGYKEMNSREEETQNSIFLQAYCFPLEWSSVFYS